MSTRRIPLPLAGQEPVERADAARNRRKILEAATRLVEANGAGSISLDEVARAACVGVGTVYRRFGDRAGLVGALVDEREKQFQLAFIDGPPPLGPGAPPAERLRAFLHGLLDHLSEQVDLFLLREKSAPTARYGSGPFRLWHHHLVMLIGQIRPEADAHYLADALLAPLTPSLLDHQRRVSGFTTERIKAGLDQLIGWSRLTGG
ncbi:MAG TPA: TetR/AcrR family transcriptional regulator [Actinophytocola sp.]|uniref:TetR/AcrR family transcriptional regulator n=1 Tax=Actinophytocola sp. TaxID=1872138 RepID=UPI002DDD1DE1|nr:TetR/AcrR family transcriptional regulator [Actinophytocola sp.]HEV2781772.1 TetR/AcrR family transcriptional regulator [Actinophytocola sp.]